MNRALHNEDVVSVVQEVFSSMLGMEISAADSTAGPGCASGRHVSASVGINGEWNGTLTLQCKSGTACLLAGAMLGTDPFPEVNCDVRDVMGELANIVAGAFKRLLPGSSTLSLPVVVEGDFSLDIVHGAEIITQALSCQGNELLVSIVRANSRSDSRSYRLANTRDRLPAVDRALDEGRA